MKKKATMKEMIMLISAISVIAIPLILATKEIVITYITKYSSHRIVHKLNTNDIIKIREEGIFDGKKMQTERDWEKVKTRIREMNK